MLTVICDTPGTLSLRERPEPSRQPNEVLIRVRRVGVCGTDMHIFSGTQPYLDYPRVMGHEFAGEVHEAPEGSSLKPGDTVFVMPYMSCGRCIACTRGRTNCCVNIQVLGVHRDGAFAEFISVPEAFVHPAEGLSLDQAAMLEFLAIGAHAARRGAVGKGDRVLVVGAGPIGMAALIFSRLRGADVVAMDSRKERIDFCCECLGAVAGVQVGDGDESELSRLSAGDFFDVVFDATGNPRAMERGFRFLAHGGRYVFVSIVKDSITFSDPEFHKREATLLGSRNATMEDFRAVIDAMKAGRIPHEALNTHRIPLGEVPEKFSRLLAPSEQVIKAIVEC
jgi:2-desacetyl-2-hydroxyethyl bacteriochlorophyllide A dehydrogenase